MRVKNLSKSVNIWQSYKQERALTSFSSMLARRVGGGDAAYVKLL